MSDFVNYNKRDVSLPAGYKNLVDLLNQKQGRGLSQRPGHSCGGFKEEQFATEGLAQVGRFVKMVLDSKAEACHVKISGIELPMDVYISRVPNENHFSLSTSVRDPQQVSAIRNLFEREGLAPLWDPEKSGLIAEIIQHILAYPLPNDAARATSIVMELLRTSDGLSDDSGLTFVFMSGMSA